jgi:plastocyanin
METKSYRVVRAAWAVVLILVVALTGCAGQRVLPAAGPGAAQSASPDVTFRLQTSSKDGKLMYMGTEGDLEGQANPDLIVDPGQVVEIILVNGDGGQGHNLVIEGYNKATGMVARKGQETHVIFTADQEGIFPYYSSAFQQREAGLAGRLVVGAAAARQAAGSSGQTGVVVQPAANPAVQPDVSYTLKTGMQDGRMVFIGSGGDLEGKVNPDLTAQVGAVVEIVLVNGDSIQHNISIEGLNVKSDYVDTQGQETRLTFTAGQAGTFAYFCDVPGHREEGMEGKFIVGQPAAA